MRWGGVNWLCVVAVGLVLAACSTPLTKTPANKAPPAADIAITRDHDRWTADYTLSQDAPVWVFIRSTLEMRTRAPWRPKQWHAETPGVVLEHFGNWDILRATNGGNVPRQVRLNLEPEPVLLEAGYPTLRFSDGATALYSGAFGVFALPSLEAVKKLPDDLNDYPMADVTVRTHWRDVSGPVLVNGKRVTKADEQDDDLYVLFGTPRVKQGAHLVTVSDPALPAWISQSLADFAPRIADYYTRRLGPGQTARPTIMITWMGPTPHVISLGGSVLPGLIVMTLEGEGLVQSSPKVLPYERWFIAHESAHFWLGQTVHYEAARDSWITEGGADLMAVRAIKTLDPAYDATSELQKEIDDCIKLGTKPVAEAGKRGEHRAYYACGAAFAMIAEASQKHATGGDWFDFVKSLIDAHRTDHVLTRTAWLAQLTKVSGDPSLARDIAGLLDNGAADPAARLAALFDRACVRYRRDGGKIVLQ